jgi:hypothetical protein
MLQHQYIDVNSAVDNVSPTTVLLRGRNVACCAHAVIYSKQHSTRRWAAGKFKSTMNLVNVYYHLIQNLFSFRTPKR